MFVLHELNTWKVCDRATNSSNFGSEGLAFHSLRSRRLEVVGERKNGRTRRRHVRGEGAPARKAPENRFNLHSVSADISN